MALLLLVGSTLMTTVTSFDVMYACQYPGCKCDDATKYPQSFILTCHVTSTVDVNIIPQTTTLNITGVIIQCRENIDPTLLLDSLQRDMGNVRSLELQNCVTSLSAIFKNRFLQLQKLRLTNVTALDSSVGQIVSERPKLQILEIMGSAVTFPGVCPLWRLSRLILSNCHMRDLDSSECQLNDTLALRLLDLSNNELQNVPNWLTWAPRLSELYLKHNRISSIPPSALQNLNLKVLDLSHNIMTSLPGNILSNMFALEYLNLSVNQFRTLPKNLMENNVNLTRLDLSLNRFRFLEADLFKSLHSLKILNLSSNSLSYLLNSHLSSLENLIYLEIIDNNLRNIPVLSAQKNLVVLNLRHNRISSILGSSLRGCTKLEGIALSHNRLQTLSLKNLAVSKKLSVIDVSHNNISYIDYRSEVDVSQGLTVNDSLAILQNVDVLLLNNNQLQDLYSLARVFTGLSVLFLDHNRISGLSSSDFPSSIRSISLSHNQISNIEAGMFATYPRLKAVSLQYNFPFLGQLPSVYVQIDSDIKPKPEMFIGGNGFVCNCRVAYLKIYHDAQEGKIMNKDNAQSFRYFSSSLPKFPDIPHVLCITELNDTVRRLIDIPPEEFVCVEEDFMCEHVCTCCTGTDNVPCPCEHPCPSQCKCSRGGSPFGEYSYKVHCPNSSLVPEGIPTPTTHLHLEGSNITTIQPNQFTSLNDLKYLYLQNSQVSGLSNGSFNGLDNLNHLHLQSNKLTRLSPEMLTGLVKLTHLFLQDNLLVVLQKGTFNQLFQLLYLDLRGNQLRGFSVEDFPHLTPSAAIRIKDNPISCDCSDILHTTPFLTIYGPNIAERNELTCAVSNDTLAYDSGDLDIEKTGYDNHSYKPIIFLEDFDLEVCNRSHTLINETHFDSLKLRSDDRYAVTLSTVCALFIIIVIVAVVLYRRRTELQAWMFVKFGVRVKAKNAGLDETGRQYDAFVSYSSHDERLVVRELAPRLEEGKGEKGAQRRYHLCLHYRDFPVGDSIADTIIESIEASKRTIMLLSDNFLASEWCRYEFQTAHHHVLKESSHRLILVLLHDIDDRKLDPDLRVHLKEDNFLRYDDPWFWEKLYFALPDVPVEKKAKLPPPPDKKHETNPEWNVTYDENDTGVRFSNTPDSEYSGIDCSDAILTGNGLNQTDFVSPCHTPENILHISI